MSEINTSGFRQNPMKFIGLIIPKLPGLIIRSGGAWLSFKKQAQKGGKTFKKELIEQGIDKETANALTKQYLENSVLMKYFINQ